MIKKISALVFVAAVIGGCGSSSSSSNTATSSSSSAPAATSSSSSAASSSTPSGGASVANNPAVKAAVAACKTRIGSAPNLSGDAKTKLSGLCDQAASGNEAGVLKAAAQVCREIVTSSVPAAAQQQALASCPKG